MTNADNWASPEELAEALRSGEIDQALTPNRREKQQKSAPPSITTSRVMADAWEKFAKEVLPLSITPEQEKWARRIFFSGAMTLMGNMLYGDILDEGNPDTATPQDVNRIDALYHELNAFFSAVSELQ
jgi:hypothetical protein